MQAIRLVPLESVILKVLELLPKDSISEEKIEEWAYESLESIAPQEVYDINVSFERVHNHKARIPKGTFKINMILYETFEHGNNTDFPVEQYTELSKNVKYTSVEPAYIVKQDELHQFINLTYRNSWRPLSICTNVFHKSILLHNSPNIYSHCKHCFSIDIRSGCIITSFDMGRLAISYSSLPQDDNGKFLMPDNQEIIKAVETYCLKRYWQFRMNMHEDGAYNLYNLYTKEYELLAPKATGVMMMPDYIEYQNLRNINKFIKEDSPFSVALGALNNSELLHYGGISNSFYNKYPFRL